MGDEDERVVFARLHEAVQELDNLCELDALAFDPEKETRAVRMEITAHGQESRKLLHRLPEQKEDAVFILQNTLRKRCYPDFNGGL